MVVLFLFTNYNKLCKTLNIVKLFYYYLKLEYNESGKTYYKGEYYG